jgi:hypothetical protein
VTDIHNIFARRSGDLARHPQHAAAGRAPPAAPLIGQACQGPQPSIPQCRPSRSGTGPPLPPPQCSRRRRIVWGRCETIDPRVRSSRGPSHEEERLFTAPAAQNGEELKTSTLTNPCRVAPKACLCRSTESIVLCWSTRNKRPGPPSIDGLHQLCIGRWMKDTSWMKGRFDGEPFMTRCMGRP